MDWKDLNPAAPGLGFNEGLRSLDNAARMSLNALYPREFEFYMVTLELVKYDDTPIEYFTFPINPESINKSQPYLKQVDRTYGAVVVNKSGKFVPQDIVLKGSFGRNFKFVTRNQTLDLSAIQWLPDGTEFSSNYKSGYGCFKLVQKICDESDLLDDGYSRKLFFHNLALGESYLVEVINFGGSQSVATNMIWDYDLRLKVLTNVYSKDQWKNFEKGAGSMLMTQGMNQIAKQGKAVLANLLRK